MEPEIVEQPDLQAAEEVTPQEPVATDETAESVDWEAKASELEAKNKQLFERAKKAEANAKPAPVPTPTAKEGDLSGKDVLALSGAGITDEEDIDVVQRAAKLQGVSIAQAVKDPIVQGILKGQQEERTTAIASSTGTSRRVPIERTGTDLVEQAKKGQLPDPKDLDKMIKARIGIK